MFNEPALNGFSKSIYEDRQNKLYNIERTVTTLCFPLSNTLDKFLSSGQRIDFLSVDVEGLDLCRYSPQMIGINTGPK